MTNSASSCSEAGESSKRFSLHYNFPPFSVGEKWASCAGRAAAKSAMALWRTLALAMIPDDHLPYTLRGLATFWNRTGPSSMARLLAPVWRSMTLGAAGIGSWRRGNGSGARRQTVRILSDIAGARRPYGDMDFKVAERVRALRAADGHQSPNVTTAV